MTRVTFELAPPSFFDILFVFLQPAYQLAFGIWNLVKPQQFTSYRFNPTAADSHELSRPMPAALVYESGILFIVTGLYQFFALRTNDLRVVKRTLLVNVIFMGMYITTFAWYLQSQPDRLPQWPVIFLSIGMPAFFALCSLMYLACWACGCRPSRDDYAVSSSLEALPPMTYEVSSRRRSGRNSSSRDSAREQPVITTYKLGYSNLT